MAQTRVDSEGPEADAAAELGLRDEARVSGFSEAEISSAHARLRLISRTNLSSSPWSR